MKFNCTYTVILDWMLDLGLNASELLAFATIYGFSQDGESAFTGSRSYLCRKIAAKSKTTADTAIDRLLEKGLIVKIERSVNGVKFCEYKVDVDALEAFVAGLNQPAQGDAQAPAAPAVPAVPSPRPKGGKVAMFLSRVTSEICPNFGPEFLSVWTTLCNEPKWRNKTENAIRMQLSKLAAVPEIEAIAMVKNAIGGEWQGLYELKPQERAALYGGQPAGGFRQGPATVQRGGVMGSEAIVSDALRRIESYGGEAVYNG